MFFVRSSFPPLVILSAVRLTLILPCYAIVLWSRALCAPLALRRLSMLSPGVQRPRYTCALYTISIMRTRARNGVAIFGDGNNYVALFGIATADPSSRLHVVFRLGALTAAVRGICLDPAEGLLTDPISP